MPAYMPLSQTFFISAIDNPDGVFVDSVDLCFFYKDDRLPITLSLCPAQFGIPNASQIYHNAEVTLYPSDIPVTSGTGTDLPNFGNSLTYTRFTFPGLVYLPHGQHAIVLKTNSNNYSLYVARMQSTILGTDRSVSRQPYVGMLFKAQNTDEWLSEESEDIMFNINIAVFSTPTQGVVEFQNIKPGGNSTIHTFHVSENDVNFGKTSIGYQYRITSNSTGVLDTSNVALLPNQGIDLSSAAVVHSVSNGSFRVVSTLATTSEFLTPIIDSTGLSVVSIENIINNAELSNSLFSMANIGNGYTSTPTVTISAPTRSGGTQATATANVTAAKTVDRIILTNPGTGYVQSPTVTITGGSGSGANAIFNGETSLTGGNALARYMTRKVQLSNGFDATDIQVYLTSSRRSVTDIQVYYKVLSDEDPDQNFDHKYWNQMPLSNSMSSVYSQSENDFLEYKYITQNGNTRYSTANSTFISFRQFAIKICMFSSDPTIVPIIRDMRGIALA